jgi:hypothetical protein
MARLLWTQKQDIGPPARSNHAMAFDGARRQVILFGGAVGSGSVGDTWVWNGENWTQVADMGPAARLGCRLAYDSQRKRAVLFGGASAVVANAGDASKLMNDTWEWDGEFWTQVADTGPSPRCMHAMAYDAARQRVLLFGGLLGDAGADGLLHGAGDTWEWDGSDWTQIEDVGPGARQSHAMAGDEGRQLVVLYGGAATLDTGSMLRDTWEWDGHGWTHRTDLGPGPLIWHAMSWSGSQVLLYGGFFTTPTTSGSSPLTWEWDGKHWTLRQDMGPGSYALHALAFDAARGRVVFFGGQHGDSTPHNDTWEGMEQPASV